MNKIIFTLIFLLWNLIHIRFFWINEVLKNADSFAYLQMSYHIKNFNIEWLWTWWFWFLYSIGIAFFDLFFNNEILSANIFNIVCLNIIWILTYLLGKNILSLKYNFLSLILLFLSPILLNFNIWILSENLYIPLFLILFLWILNFKSNSNITTTLFLSFIVALMYLTRAEAFIYVWSIWIIFIYLWLIKKYNFKKFLILSITWILWFFIFISPYLFHLYNITGEIWLTNKGTSNLRQAELRWLDKMDNDWFEKAVWELTPDNHHLMAWFAWWLKYDKSYENLSLKKYFLDNPHKIMSRMLDNQKKLYSQNLIRIIWWWASDLYKVEWSRIFYKNILFYLISLLPIFLCLYWIISLIKNKKYYFLISFLSFYLTASFFFTIFFVLDRYFIIFLPIFIVLISYWLENIKYNNKILHNLLFYSIWIVLILIYSLWLLSYYNSNKWLDEYYKVKQIAWEYLKEYHNSKVNLKIMERFPIVTYYSWTKQRWITPYTDKLQDIIEYAKYNNLDYLIVDTLDFKKYRQNLIFLLEKKLVNNDISILKEIEYNEQKVIIFKINK